MRTRCLLTITLLLLSGPAILSARPTAEEKERAEAWETAQAEFLKAFKSSEPGERRAAVLALREFADLGAAEVVCENVLGRERHAGVLDAAMQVVSATTDPKLIEWIAKEATGRAKWPERVTLVEALGYIESPVADEAILEVLREDDDPRLLSMALFGVAEKKMKGAFEDVVELLEHSDWQVRVAAIEALTAFGEERGVIPLVDRLMNEQGRLRVDLADALKKLTGQDFGRDANKWRKWFYDRDSVPRVEPPKEAGPPGSTVQEPTYFGIKVVSDRVVFVLDVSMSMRTPIDVDKMKLAREAALTGDDGTAANKDDESFEQTIKWWEIKDRLDLAKAQLKFVIKNLGEKQQFEVVTFSEKITPWNGGKLMKASKRAKTKAIQFIDTVEVEGATAAGAALDFIFEMAGPGAADKNYRSGVDTVFFLSDGAPSDRPEDEILEQVKLRNRMRKIKCHVVAIMNYSVKFLRLLAEQSGGTYKFFKVEDK